jgi:hypothetical protein
VQPSRNIPASDFFMEEIGGGRFFVSSCLQINNKKQTTMNKQTPYVPPGIEVCRVALEGIIADSISPTFANNRPQIEDFGTDTQYDSEYDLLVF